MNSPLDSYRRAQIRTAINWGSFPNVTQAGKYCLKRFRNAGDGHKERLAILRTVWEWHLDVTKFDIPFTFLVGVFLCLLTGCTPY